MHNQLYIPPTESATTSIVHALTETEVYEQDLETLLVTLDLIREQDAAIERGEWLFAPKYNGIISNNEVMR